MKKKKVALVLGGGAALGFAHIGVIKVLEQNGINIDMVVGTSMGALVGATYCAGLNPKQMIEVASKFKTFDMVDFNFNKSGLFSGKGVMKTIAKILPDINIEELNKEFACVACDLLTEKEVVLASGNLREAVRASISIPGVFVPVEKDDMLLIDGGVINNLPEEVAINMGAEVIISVDVLNKSKVRELPKSFIETLLAGINISIKEIQKYKSYHADILICPDVGDVGQMAFTKKATIGCIKKGEKEAKKHIEEILKALKA
jgi:NTE family protein